MRGKDMHGISPIRLVTAEKAVACPESALDQAFRAHASHVAGVALHILGRSDEADDLVQDVFMKAGAWVCRLREPSALRAWLTKVTVRLAWRRLRRRRWRTVMGLEVASYDYNEVANHERLSPEDGAFMAEVYRILDRIPARERLAWTLRHVEGERLEDVAAHCGCSLATVKRWIASAATRIDQEVGHERRG
jgi:RNA polymerase sigma-70 factor (ECF subfamily)